MSLTPKQEKFCQCIVSGMSNKDSYMSAYDTESDNTAYIESTKLLKRDDIKERITDLRKPIEKSIQDKVVSDRERKRSFLWNVIHDENQTMSDRLKATDLLNKMDSEYIAQTRLECDNKTVISGLDTDALKRLLEKN